MQRNIGAELVQRTTHMNDMLEAIGQAGGDSPPPVERTPDPARDETPPEPASMPEREPS